MLILRLAGLSLSQLAGAPASPTASRHKGVSEHVHERATLIFPLSRCSVSWKASSTSGSLRDWGGMAQLIWHVPLPLLLPAPHILFTPPPGLPPSLVRSLRLSLQYAITLKNKENIVGDDGPTFACLFSEQYPSQGIKPFFLPPHPTQSMKTFLT